VPYRGEALALPDLLSGQVGVLFGNFPSSIEYVRTGKLRPLAVTTAKRSNALPDIPTVGDFVPGYEASVINGIGAPKNTPSAVIDKLNKRSTMPLLIQNLRRDLLNSALSQCR